MFLQAVSTPASGYASVVTLAIPQKACFSYLSPDSPVYGLFLVPFPLPSLMALAASFWMFFFFPYWLLARTAHDDAGGHKPETPSWFPLVFMLHSRRCALPSATVARPYLSFLQSLSFLPAQMFRDFAFVQLLILARRFFSPLSLVPLCCFFLLALSFPLSDFLQGGSVPFEQAAPP